MKKLIFLCIITLIAVSCTTDVKSDTMADPPLDDITTMVLNNANTSMMQSCIIVDDKVIVLPKNSYESVIVVKHYDIFLTVLVTTFVAFITGFIIGVVAAVVHENS